MTKELEEARARLAKRCAEIDAHYARYPNSPDRTAEQHAADLRTLLAAPKGEVVFTDDRLIEACKSALLRLADEEADLRAAERMREQAAHLWSDDDSEDRDAALRMLRYVLEALYAHTGGGDE